MNQTIGKIEQLTNTPPTVGAVRRVVKRTDFKTPEHHLRDHALGAMRALVTMYPKEAVDIVREMVDISVRK